ncbi:PA2779 family protein [Ramlibacter algicola]|uniref:PA2779 family protein n=1 Tax=Ramlibacter algicola TaxID=2795217 RepID=A0A934PZL8_9BURK|nr:PA2779 family protein [Ramlibacter algicola]MBK0392056.1 PA2779 family protein [Ramlibacter algicola]
MPIPSQRLRRAGTCLAAALALHAPLAGAGMLPAEAAIAASPSPADQDRAKVRAFLERSTVQERLVALGVTGLDAPARVDAMTEQEVHALAGRIDALPAGGALSDRDIILILLVTLLLVVVL